MRFFISRVSHRFGPPPAPVPEAVEAAHDAEGTRWAIEIETLDDLLQLADREGPLVVNAGDRSVAEPWIEIYDDYAE